MDPATRYTLRCDAPNVMVWVHRIRHQEFVAFARCFRVLTMILMLSYRNIHDREIKKMLNRQLYSRYRAEACNEWRDPSPGLSVLATRNVAAVASRWRHCVRFDQPGIKLKPPAPIGIFFNTLLTDRWDRKLPGSNLTKLRSCARSKILKYLTTDLNRSLK